jgi:hypothetical protein
LFCYGGQSQHEIYDPKPDAPAEVRGEFQPIQTSVPGLYVGEHIPRLAGVMDRCAIIRSMHHENRLHDSASIETFTGRKPPLGDIELFSPMPQLFPSIGSRVTYGGSGVSRSAATVRHAVLPFFFRNVHPVPCQGAGFLGAAFDPFLIEVDPAERRYRAELLETQAGLDTNRREKRRELLEAVDPGENVSLSASPIRKHFRKAFELLDSPVIRKAIDVEHEDPRTRERYGMGTNIGWEPGGEARAQHGYARNMRGQNLLLARRLVEAGVPFIDVHDYQQQGQNWDTHAQGFSQLRELLLPQFDQAVSALIEDLDARGLLESTLVVAAGEFGRTPRLNGSAGRDHWPDCYSVLLAGGGVRGGTTLGASDRFAAYPASTPVSPADLSATILWRFGIDPATEIRDPQNRPFPLSDGRPLVELFA